MSRDATMQDVIDGRARWCVVCADNAEVLPKLPAVDAVVTDPPYGYAYASNWPGKFKGREINCDDSERVRDEVAEWAWKNAGAWCFFGSWKNTVLPHTRGVLVWSKGPASGMGDLSFPWKPSWELAFCGGKAWSGDRTEGVLTGHTVVTWSGAAGQREHPNEKPWSLMAEIISKTMGDLVLDPFCGSGTTGVACLRLGRRFIGIEKDAHYAAVARDRLDAESRGLTLRDVRHGQRGLFEEVTP